MALSWVQLVFGFSLFLFVSCQNPTIYSCSVPNDCTNVESGYSYCREGQCRQCDPELKHKDCQCPLNQYCITDRNNTNWGYCRDIYSDNIIGTSCNRDLSNDWQSVNQSTNGLMFCGKIVYNATGHPEILEWKGSCIQGICAQCSSIPIPSVPFAYCEDGRSCRYDGKFVIAPAGMLSWNYIWYQPMEIVFYITLIPFTGAIVTLAIVLCYAIWNTRRKLKKA